MDSSEHKKFITETFNTVASGYDNPSLYFFPQTAEYLATLLKPIKDQTSILDIATGTGCAAITLAKQFPNSDITGIDLSDGMLAQARSKATQSQIQNVSFAIMDMQNLTFTDNSFDIAACSFGLFFLEDMETQLKHIATKLKSNGKIAVTSFQDDAFTPFIELFLSQLEAYGVEISPPSWKRVGSTNQCINLLEKANFIDVQCNPLKLDRQFDNAEQWWDIVWNAGYRGLLEQLSAENLIEFKKEHLETINREIIEKNIPIKLTTLCTIAVKP